MGSEFDQRFRMGAVGTGRRPPRTIDLDYYREWVRNLIEGGKTLLGAIWHIQKMLRMG